MSGQVLGLCIEQGIRGTNVWELKELTGNVLQYVQCAVRLVLYIGFDIKESGAGTMLSGTGYPTYHSYRKDKQHQQTICPNT